MPPVNRPPSMRKKRVRGHDYAVCTVRDPVTGRRRDLYLGRWGDAAVASQYARVVADWRAGVSPLATPDPAMTIVEVCNAWWSAHQGKLHPTEQRNYQLLLRAWRLFAGDVPVRDFGPRHMRAFTNALLLPDDSTMRRAWSPRTVRRMRLRLHAVVKWAVSHELIPANVWAAIATVERVDVEPAQPRPVDDAHIQAVLPHLTPTLAAMVRLQRLTGMRPGEVIGMTPAQIDRSGDVWVYRPTRHKLTHRGLRREVMLGPQAQRILALFLVRPDDAPCFAPADSRRAAWESMESQSRRYGRRKARHEQRQAGPAKAYRADSYSRAIARACKRAGVPPWTPYQLRHTFATQLRKLAGLESTAVMLDHSSTVITDAVYAARDATEKISLAKRFG